MSGAWHPRRVLLIGGTSEIGLAILLALAEKGPLEVVLAGREREELQRTEERLRAQGEVRTHLIAGLRAQQPAGHGEIVSQAFQTLGNVDIAILAVGVLGSRGGLPEDIAEAVDVLEVNARGAGSLLMHAAARMREQGGGSVMVLSSVAAERPRRSNAVYGASKAALDALAQALADDLRHDGVQIMVIRPGFVHTRMTAGLPVPPLACTPAEVARAALAGLESGAQTVWAPPVMRWVMLALRALPRSVFRRLSL